MPDLVQVGQLIVALLGGGAGAYAAITSRRAQSRKDIMESKGQAFSELEKTVNILSDERDSYRALATQARDDAAGAHALATAAERAAREAARCAEDATYEARAARAATVACEEREKRLRSDLTSATERIRVLEGTP